MAVLAMKRISLYALKEQRKKILELLQRRGVVEVASSPDTGECFSKTDTAQPRATFEKSIQQLEAAAAILDKYAPPEKGLPKMLAGRDRITVAAYEQTAMTAADISGDAYRVVGLEKKITDSEAEILRFEAQIEALLPWKNLDISMRTLGTSSLSIFIGSFPEELTEADLKQKIAQALPELPAVQVEVVSAQSQMTCVCVMCHIKYGMQMESCLRSLGFTYPASPSKEPPAQRIELLRKQIEAEKREMETARQEIIAQADKRLQFHYTADYFTMRADKYRVLGELLQSSHLFVVTGYIPEQDALTLQRELEEKFQVFVELETPDEEEEVPVKLKNNSFTAPVEGVVAGYSLPLKHEVDPSSIMAIFYYVLFGMMLSDAAYGLLVTVGCAVVLWKFKNIEEGLRKSLQMFFYCGISTTFWGVMFGSYFGDAIPVIAKTFFQTDLTIPAVWFVPLENPMQLLLFSFLLGIIHLFTGLGVQLYQLLKSKKYADALYDVVFWYFLVGGLIIFLLSTDMFNEMMALGFQFPALVGTVAMVFAGIGAVGIILTAGRESKSPVKRGLKGLYGLYNVSGYLSDILSYSRLLALGLATGVIATVFNQMGSMLGGGVVGAIFFILVFLVGHSMNLAINLLGAYVHTNRLQYVEFFGKFYEGGGRKFEPFSAKTKYFKITEEK